MGILTLLWKILTSKTADNLVPRIIEVWQQKTFTITLTALVMFWVNCVERARTNSRNLYLNKDIRLSLDQDRYKSYHRLYRNMSICKRWKAHLIGSPIYANYDLIGNWYRIISTKRFVAYFIFTNHASF